MLKLCRATFQPSTPHCIHIRRQSSLRYSRVCRSALPSFRLQSRIFTALNIRNKSRVISKTYERNFRTLHHQADDDLADSLRNHPGPIPSAGASQATVVAAEGAYDFFEESVENDEYVASTGVLENRSDQTNGGSKSKSQDEENDGCARSDSLPKLRPDSVTRSRPSCVPEEEGSGNESRHIESNFVLHTGANSSIPRGDPDHQGSLRLGTSLGWEVAHLLHVCLGRYLESGGPSPGVSYIVLYRVKNMIFVLFVEFLFFCMLFGWATSL